MLRAENLAVVSDLSNDLGCPVVRQPRLFAENPAVLINRRSALARWNARWRRQATERLVGCIRYVTRPFLERLGD